uniref:CN hydrolase domain-containing protein n=1 Tax=Panagrolaimus sp. ES5 TaxID=591445 RepID=A0AC34FJW7_9BILA
MSKSKIAIVQAGSIFYDTPATIDKLERLTQEAAKGGAELILFPEGFIGGYPKGLNFGLSVYAPTSEGRDEFKKYFESAIEYDSRESDRIAKCAAINKVYLVVGVIERDGGTLYCSVFFYSPEGEKLGKHRKLVPTTLERCIWDAGDGSTMPVLDTKVGKIGTAICWTNYMPLFRMTYYKKGIELYLAPTADDGDHWLSLMRTIAVEGRVFVISACQFFTSADYPTDHASHDPSATILMHGGSCAVDPFGKVLLEPDFTKEKIAFVEIDLAEIPRAKFDLDVVGHYSRPDIFQLTVNENEQNTVRFNQ